MEVTQVKVSVTEDDLQYGRRADCHKCPIALALQRVLKSGAKVTVFSSWFEWEAIVPPQKKYRSKIGSSFMAESAQLFIRSFDSNQWPVVPFNFIVSIPTLCLP